VDTELAEAPAARAREEGITTFTALFLAASKHVLELLRRLGEGRILSQEQGASSSASSSAPARELPAFWLLVPGATARAIVVP